MLVLDTSVLVYASGADHPLREPAVRLLRDVVASRVSATTTPEVLQQYAHVRARHRGDRPWLGGCLSGSEFRFGYRPAMD